MKTLILKLHNRLGDFWWYTLMIFIAARAADCLNVFVGLWLVPKYVPPSELGAVQPLTQFAGFLATHNITYLPAMLWWMTGFAVLKALGCALAMLHQKSLSTRPIQ